MTRTMDPLHFTRPSIGAGTITLPLFHALCESDVDLVCAACEGMRHA
jgi:hypothetical protein